MPLVESLLFACSAPQSPSNPDLGEQPSRDGLTTPLEDRCQGDPLCVDVALVPPSVTVEDGVEVLGRARPVADANGDGERDLAVGQWFLFSPVLGEKLLPRDADLTVFGVGYDFGDVDGDGIIDVVSEEGYVSGPLADVVDVAASPTVRWPDADAAGAAYAFPSDYDGDGALELVWIMDEEFRAWKGDPATWGVGEATLTVRFGACADPQWMAVLAFPDVDGDTRPELVASPSGGCGGNWLLPIGVAGVIEPATDPEALKLSTFPTCFPGDQNGDLAPDVCVGRTLYAGPAVFDAGSFASDQVLFEDLPEGRWVMQLDLTGDGVLDWYDDEAPVPESPENHPWVQWAILSGGPLGTHLTGQPLVRIVYDIPYFSPLDLTRVEPDGRIAWAITDDEDRSVRFVAIPPSM